MQLFMPMLREGTLPFGIDFANRLKRSTSPSVLGSARKKGWSCERNELRRDIQLTHEIFQQANRSTKKERTFAGRRTERLPVAGSLLARSQQFLIAEQHCLRLDISCRKQELVATQHILRRGRYTSNTNKRKTKHKLRRTVTTKYDGDEHCESRTMYTLFLQIWTTRIARAGEVRQRGKKKKNETEQDDKQPSESK